MPFRTLIFDLDGTLVDTARDVHFCINQARAQMGLPPISLEQAQQSIGPGPNKFVEIVLPPEKRDRLDDFIRIFRGFYLGHLSDHSRPFPGVEGVLTELQRQGFVLVVATNKPRRYTEKLLRDVGLWSCFSYILTPDDVANRKPEPDIVFKALEVTQTQPGEALFVGDTDNDILAGQAAGVPTCGVTYGYGSRELLRQLNPDFLIDRPEELLDIVSIRGTAPEKVRAVFNEAP